MRFRWAVLTASIALIAAAPAAHAATWIGPGAELMPIDPQSGATTGCESPMRLSEARAPQRRPLAHLRTRTLSGTAGTHTTHLPRHHKNDRLVLTTAGRTLKIITLPR
jgi:hypothetical protein